MKDAQGNWTGKYGVTSESDFLKNPVAQERAFADTLATYDRQLRSKGVMRTIGQRINGQSGQFTVTEDGLIAAAHRGGATAVDNYLKHQQRNGWNSNFSNLPQRQAAAFNEIETRLREFEKVRRNKPAVAP